jgi:hypothetical protein
LLLTPKTVLEPTLSQFQGLLRHEPQQQEQQGHMQPAQQLQGNFRFLCSCVERFSLSVKMRTRERSWIYVSECAIVYYVSKQ